MAKVLTTIIPTVCSEQRRDSLLRAIDSALASTAQESLVLVVANGPRVSDLLFQEIQRLQCVKSIRLEAGSLPNAMIEGRKLVETEFFCFLDDDDELLPGASELRLQQLQRNVHADVAVINGFRQVGGLREPHMSSLHGVADDPLRTLLEANWLASCAGLYRAHTIGVEVFLDPQPLAEWTWLAYRLALLEKRFCVVDEPGYVIHDTPSSLSKAQGYLEGYISLFDRMLNEQPPAWAKRRIVQKRCDTLHSLAERALLSGEYGQAWRFHAQSMAALGGLKYFLFGRKILKGALFAQARSP
jgi:hypothetical protein